MSVNTIQNSSTSINNSLANTSTNLSSTGNTESQSQELINKQKMDIKKLAQMIKDSQNKHMEEIKQLKEELEKKEEENKNLKEKLKNLEKTSNDVMKNLAKGNVSEITELQKQFESEILVNKELIKTYSNTIKEKNQEISKFSDEVIYLRGLLEEEKKRAECYFTNIKYKLELKSSDVEIYKLMTENSALKSKLVNLEENLDKKNEIIDKLKEELNLSGKTLNDNIDSLKIELNLKEKSYTNLIKDYYQSTAILANTQTELEKKVYLLNKLQGDLEELRFKVKGNEREILEVKRENETLVIEKKGKQCEVDILAKKLKETELKALDYKLSKQIFHVKYNYLKMTMDGSILMKKEDNDYYFAIENKASTRTFSFLEIDIRADYNDPYKFFIRLLKENKEEEYFSNDVATIIEYFEDFRKKAIEVSEMYRDGDSNIKRTESKISNASTRKPVAKEKIRNLLEF